MTANEILALIGIAILAVTALVYHWKRRRDRPCTYSHARISDPPREWPQPEHPPKPPGAPQPGKGSRTWPDWSPDIRAMELRMQLMELPAGPCCARCRRPFIIGERICLSLDRQVVHQDCPLADRPAPDRTRA
ncbi:MAG: hypothetical protein RLZZ127_1523 [Planctomycetota bacterium]|jgi:LPXTG-motif cell wall-anchored protein